MKFCQSLNLVTVALQAILCFSDSSQYVDGYSPSSSFQLTRVTREEESDFYRVRVEYEAETKPVAVIINLVRGTPTPAQDNSQLGVVEMRIPKNKGSDERYQHSLVHFIYPDFFRAIVLNLNTAASMDLPRIHLDVQQGGEVTFPSGTTELELEATFKVDAAPETLDKDGFSYQLYLKSERQENEVNRYHGQLRPYRKDSHLPAWFDLVDYSGDVGDRRGKARFNSTLDDPRGIVEVFAGVSFSCSDACLVELAVTTTVVKFYSDDHETPFPPDFLGFVLDEYQYDDQTQIYCNTRDHSEQPCVITCDVIGNQPSTADIVRVLPDGDVRATNDVSFTGAGFSSTAILSFYDVTSSDSGHYRCRARTGSTEVVKDIRLITYQSPQFDKEASKVTIFENGTIAATCVAEGNPSPNVTFDTYIGVFYDRYPGEDYDVTMTKESETRTRADIIIYNPEMASQMYSLHCTAINDVETFDPYRFQEFFSLNVREEIPPY